MKASADKLIYILGVRRQLCNANTGAACINSADTGATVLHQCMCPQDTLAPEAADMLCNAYTISLNTALI